MGKTVLIHPLGEGGHLAPTLHLARKLRDRGDRVIYLAERTLEKRVIAEGFGFVPDRDGGYDDAAAETSRAWYLEKEAHMWRNVETRALDEQLEPLHLDLILYDATRFFTGLVAHRLGIPRARFTTSFPMGREGCIPPIWSDALPDEVCAHQIDREWASYETIFWEPPYLGQEEPITRAQLYQVATDCGVALEHVRKGAFGYFIDCDPELVMTTALLEFPQAPALEHRVYAGPCMGEAEPAPWQGQRRREGAPLVYCAFGGQSESHPTLTDFLASLMAFAREAGDVDFVLATPDTLARKLEIPENVEQLGWAPQRAILREADLFITHAGQSSMKEALWAGVPMLACPQAYDQHGNAARVFYHKLGMRILEASPASEELGAAIREVLQEPSYAHNARTMGAEMRAEAVSQRDVHFVDAVLAGNGQDNSEKTEELRAKILRNIYGYSSVSEVVES